MLYSRYLCETNFESYPIVRRESPVETKRPWSQDTFWTRCLICILFLLPDSCHWAVADPAALAKSLLSLFSIIVICFGGFHFVDGSVEKLYWKAVLTFLNNNFKASSGSAEYFTLPCCNLNADNSSRDTYLLFCLYDPCMVQNMAV